MVREIVNDGDAVHFCFHFQATLDALETLQGLRNDFQWDAVMCSQDSCRRSVPNVVLASQRKLKIRPGSAVSLDRPSGAIALKAKIRDTPHGTSGSAVTLHWTESARETAIDAFTAIECDNAAPTRYQVHQALECSLNRIKVFINVSVIEFD